MGTRHRLTNGRTYANLLSWRRDLRLSQTEAAKILGMSQKSYSRLETGQRFVKGKVAAQLMDRTGVPLEVLVGAA